MKDGFLVASSSQLWELCCKEAMVRALVVCLPFAVVDIDVFSPFTVWAETTYWSLVIFPATPGALGEGRWRCKGGGRGG